jgi:hypothetical protein
VAAVIVTLRMVGGPPPGFDKPVAGTVIATDPGGRRCTTAVGPSGELTMTLAPNSYSLTGYSPSYGDGTYPCSAERPIRVNERPAISQGPPPRAEVICAVR